MTNKGIIMSTPNGRIYYRRETRQRLRPKPWGRTEIEIESDFFYLLLAPDQTVEIGQWYPGQPFVPLDRGRFETHGDQIALLWPDGARNEGIRRGELELQFGDHVYTFLKPTVMA